MFIQYPVILHVPYCSTYIPPEVKDSIILTDEQTETELLAMTDHYTDELFAVPGIDMIAGQVSRLAVDVERLRDDKDEAMASAGMGAVYTHASDGRQLRNVYPELREKYLSQYYDPYHAAFVQLVELCLGTHGKCLIINCHSFSSQTLPYEEEQLWPRPDICLGSSDYHTPGELFQFAFRRFATLYSVDLNSPFAGTFVPGQYCLSDQRITSIMIKVNRSLYMNEANGQKSDSYSNTRKTIASIIMDIIVQNQAMSRMSEILARRAGQESDRITCVRCSMGKPGRI